MNKVRLFVYNNTDAMDGIAAHRGQMQQLQREMAGKNPIFVHFENTQ